MSAGCRAAICFLPSSRPPGGELQTPLAAACSCPLHWVPLLQQQSLVFSPFAWDPPSSGHLFGVSGPISRVSPSASPMVSQPENVGSPILQENLPPKKGERLLDKLSQVLTEGFAARPLALSVAVERVGAGSLFVGRAAEDGKGL